MPAEQLQPYEDELRALLAAHADFEVHRDNWRAVQFFARMETQWRLVLTMGGGIFTGLDYAAVFASMAGLRVCPARRRQLFADLQTMEAAAIDELNRPALEKAGKRGA